MGTGRCACFVGYLEAKEEDSGIKGGTSPPPHEGQHPINVDISVELKKYKKWFCVLMTRHFGKAYVDDFVSRAHPLAQKSSHNTFFRFLGTCLSK